MKDEQGISLCTSNFDMRRMYESIDTHELDESLIAKINAELEEIKKHRDNIEKIIDDYVWTKTIIVALETAAKEVGCKD